MEKQYFRRINIKWFDIMLLDLIITFYYTRYLARSVQKFLTQSE